MGVGAFQNPRGLRAREFFGLGTARGYYDANLPAILQQAARSSVNIADADRCRRCKGGQKFGSQCSQTYLNGALLNYGACNGCQMDGNHTKCDFYRKSLSLRLVIEASFVLSTNIFRS